MFTLLRPEGFNCITDLSLKSLNSVDVTKFKKFFDRLPADPYLKGNYRFRRLSNFKVSSNNLIKLPHSRLFQSKDYNPLLGDVVREFEELDEQMLELEDFKNLVLEYFAFCQICSTHEELGVHQIRTTTSNQKIGNPAPEGIHRDGVDLVGIFCVNRENIEGGETCLYRDKNGSPVFKQILNPGELLVFSDRHFYHYTAPIKPIGKGQGIRDVFVITCPGLMPKGYETNSN
jgi:hypothetical protein